MYKEITRQIIDDLECNRLPVTLSRFKADEHGELGPTMQPCARIRKGLVSGPMMLFDPDRAPLQDLKDDADLAEGSNTCQIN